MLIRILLKNIFSFEELTSFDLLAAENEDKPHHLAPFGNNEIKIVKLSAIYGANAAGKSNLIKAVEALREFVTTGEMPAPFFSETFKLAADHDKKDVYFGLEFIKNEIPLYYSLTLNQGTIIEERLEVSGLGVSENKMLFNRNDGPDGKRIITFDESITADPEAALFADLLEHDLLQGGQSLLYPLRLSKNKAFEIAKSAFQWFHDDLIVVSPTSRPLGLAGILENRSPFREFARETIAAFHTGIAEIEVEHVPIDDFLGKDNAAEAQAIRKELQATPGRFKVMRNEFEEILLSTEDGEVVAKRLVFRHHEDDGQSVFRPAQESDGTRRLLDYLPMLFSLIQDSKTYLVDEIERSLHPVLSKKLLEKISQTPDRRGQLIFTTHESNLLDLAIFRPDEIWFAEKNKRGATEFYPLSEFLDQQPLHLRNGYLNGRFGAIPFLGNFEDLNGN